MIQFLKFSTLFIILVSSFNTYSKGSKLPVEISAKIETLLKKRGYNKDNLSLSVKSFDEKFNLNIQSSQAQIPASTLKILTAYYILKNTDSEKSLITKLKINGKIKNGVLVGDLYLIGGADPYITSAKLMNLVLSLKKSGIKEVKGKFYFVDNFITKVDKLSKIGLGDQTYNQSVGALSSNFNRFKVFFSKKEHHLVPPLENRVLNQVSHSFGPGQKFDFENGSWNYSSRIRYKKSEEIPVRRPALYTSELFRYLASFHDIKIPQVNDGNSNYKDFKFKTIGKIKSLPLYELVSLAMEYSNNLFMETLLLYTDKVTTNKNNTLASASENMKKWYAKKFPTLDWSSSHFVNGSGLSSKNLISPKTLTSLIHLIKDDQFKDNFFLPLLSISGVSGFLSKRLNSPETSYSVWAKSGSLDYVSNLSGVYWDKAKKGYSFTIMIYDRKKRKTLDGKNSKSVNILRKQSSIWKKRADAIIDKVLESLITK